MDVRPATGIGLWDWTGRGLSSKGGCAVKPHQHFVALAIVAIVALGAARHAAAAAPIAAADGYSVKQQAVSWTEKLTVDAPAGVLINDSDPDNDLLVAALVPGSGPTGGSLTYFNADGSFEYVPDS